MAGILSGPPLVRFPFPLCVQIIKHEGFLSLYKGAGANVLRGIVGAGVLTGFEQLQELYIAARFGE